jgi:hypothetical protein
MSSTPKNDFFLIDPNQIGKAAGIDAALGAIDSALSGELVVQADDGSHASPWTIPYQAGDEPASTKTALRFILMAVQGNLAADWTAYMPAGKSKLFIVWNLTTGGRNVIVKVSGQTGVTVPPNTYMLCYLNGSDVQQISLSSSAIAQPYDAANFINGQPTAGQTIMRWVFPRTVTFPSNFSNNFMFSRVNAAGTAVFVVAKNGVQVGTATFTGGTATAVWASTSGAPVVFNAGDVLTFVAPNPADAALTDLDWVFAGTR